MTNRIYRRVSIVFLNQFLKVSRKFENRRILGPIEAGSKGTGEFSGNDFLGLKIASEKCF
jgi:hypothetical protein